MRSTTFLIADGVSVRALDRHGRTRVDTECHFIKHYVRPRVLPSPPEFVGIDEEESVSQLLLSSPEPEVLSVVSLARTTPGDRKGSTRAHAASAGSAFVFGITISASRVPRRFAAQLKSRSICLPNSKLSLENA
jgi:hypothetical protein